MPAELTGTPSQLAHIVFFTLIDSTPDNRRKLVALCREHLSGHPGEVYFSVGTLADYSRPVNDREFDVALQVVFESRDAQDAYQSAPRHLKFIELAKPMWKRVRVFDSDIAEG